MLLVPLQGRKGRQGASTDSCINVSREGERQRRRQARVTLQGDSLYIPTSTSSPVVQPGRTHAACSPVRRCAWRGCWGVRMEAAICCIVNLQFIVSSA
jgi:predicted membrane-bound mannosyltransferase